jgi:hypothetical protein
LRVKRPLQIEQCVKRIGKRGDHGRTLAAVWSAGLRQSKRDLNTYLFARICALRFRRLQHSIVSRLDACVLDHYARGRNSMPKQFANGCRSARHSMREPEIIDSLYLVRGQHELEPFFPDQTAFAVAIFHVAILQICQEPQKRQARLVLPIHLLLIYVNFVPEPKRKIGFVGGTTIATDWNIV